jgi:HAD superfamily hydrolase (TIGR01490 family)
MMREKIVAVFDFDGTITTDDVFIKFIRFVKGSPLFYLGFVLYSPYLLAFKLGLYPNWKVKQKLFSFFFKGVPLSTFNIWCKEFHEHSLYLIRPEAETFINHHLENGDSVVVISANFVNKVQPFAEQLGITQLLCTEIETDDSGCLTGRFSSPNCYGEEKVRRLLELYPERSKYHLVVYGDSKGDEALLNFADEGFYKNKKIKTECLQYSGF